LSRVSVTLTLSPLSGFGNPVRTRFGFEIHGTKFRVHGDSIRVQGPGAEPKFTIGVTGTGCRTRPGSTRRIDEAGGKHGHSDRTRGDVVDVRGPDDKSGVESKQLGFVYWSWWTDAATDHHSDNLSYSAWQYVCNARSMLLRVKSALVG